MCDENSCLVERNSFVTAEVTFTPTKNYTNIEAFLNANVGGIWIDSPIPPPYNEVCNYLTPGCPTTPNVEHVWTIEIPTTNPNETAPASALFECEFFYSF